MGWAPLRAKLQAPPARGLVERPRLWDALDRAWSHPLTLICAPAGAGKTALAAGWAARQRAAGRAVGWLTLDSGDSDPAALLRYLREALRSCAPPAAAALGDGADPDALINALAALPGEVALVLDGWDLAEGAGAGRLLARLVDYMPPAAHLVLAARREPDLPLARWRAGGQLWELGLADLRLTAGEARELLGLAGVELSEAAAAALAARAEGWAAALHLAALALRGEADPDSAAAALRGTQRYIAAYLRDEVLPGLPPAARDLLRRCAVLDRLSPGLCDAALGPGAPPSAPLLEALAREGLLLSPLDPRGEWLRVHPLLRDALLAEPAPDAGAHARAAAWLDRRGDSEAAARHALAAGDPGLAADILARHAPALMGRRELGALARLLAELPPAEVRARPRLCLAQIWLLLDASRPRAAGDLLGRLAADPPGELGAEVLALHALHAAMTGRPAEAEALARRAEELHPAADPLARALVAYGLGGAAKMGWQAWRAERHLREAAAAAAAAGNSYLASEALGNVGDLLADQGRLPEARAALEEALALARAPGGAEPPSAGWLRWGLARIAYERGDLPGALAEAALAADLCERWGNAAMWTRSLLLAAQAAQAAGDEAAALRWLEGAERAAHLAEDDRLRHAALRRRLSLAISGRRLEEARQLAELAEARAPSPAPAGHELAMARWWLAAGQPADALARARAALGRLEPTYLAPLTAQARALEALALRALGRGAEALESLERALALGQPGGCARSILDEGPSVVELLRRLAGSSPRAAYIGELLRAAAAPAAPGPGAPLEPLTARELQVLRLLAAGQSNREIAGRLVIAESTAKRHVSNLYLKLGVQSRTQAVARASELGLV